VPSPKEVSLFFVCISFPGMPFKMMPKWGHWFWITAVMLQFSGMDIKAIFLHQFPKVCMEKVSERGLMRIKKNASIERHC